MPTRDPWQNNKSSLINHTYRKWCLIGLFISSLLCDYSFKKCVSVFFKTLTLKVVFVDYYMILSSFQMAVIQNNDMRTHFHKNDKIISTNTKTLSRVKAWQSTTVICKLWPLGQSCLLPFSVNKIAVDDSRAHGLVCCQWLLSWYRTRWTLNGRETLNNYHMVLFSQEMSLTSNLE